MKNKAIAILSFIIFYSTLIKAQLPVQVREEPRHRPVFQNNYIRLLDVWLSPGDTTLYHIHSTPSVFVILSGAITGWQIKGGDWKKEQSLAGTVWYRSFTPDTLIHRVANFDTVPFHVNDVEILAPYYKGKLPENAVLPFTLLHENEQVAAYQISNLSKKQVIQNRGPILAELVKGDDVIYHAISSTQTKKIKQGSYLYIEPGDNFYFTAKGPGEINLVLFEFK